MPGLLIVNADDFGGNPLATERIAECFAAKRISSTTAMVYMRSSRRAAQLDAEHRLAIGLHLNLTQELDDPETPASVRERHLQAMRHFAGRRRARFTFNPALMRLVEGCVRDQLERFRELFGREPTHIDGHNHVHLSPTVLLALPKGARVRTAESNFPLRGHGAGSMVRRARHAFIAERQSTTDRMYAIAQLRGDLSLATIRQLLASAQRLSVEIMVHPDRDSDYRLLTSKPWETAIGEHRLGCFADITPPVRRD